jgi:ATP-dependent RNA/DNA helicase IGHMBP2
MDYFRRLTELLKIEKDEDRRSYEALRKNLSVQQRRENGITWFPIAIKGTEIGKGDYLSVEVERTSHFDIIHQFRFGMTVAVFSNHDATADRMEGTLTHISAVGMKISLRVDELPDWTKRGKLGVDVVFDENSYEEMERALKMAPVIAEKKEEGKLLNIITGKKEPSFSATASFVDSDLNSMQKAAVEKILSANELAIIHGPPGTGKTTTLVAAIKAILQQQKQKILVVAPSNAAVDLLSEKISLQGMNVLRVGNPARVSERQLSLTLDHKISLHNSFKEIKRLKKQAAEYRDLAHKYKRSFGASEREQRKALFAEAKNISKEVERTEQYIIDDLVAKADVITATLVGSSHYTVRGLKYETVVIDEAGQALEPACLIPILKTSRLIMAGDHCQLPPTIRSVEAAKGGLEKTLLEKLVELYPGSVTLLEEQYRMHETIMNFSSAEFYHDKLIAHPSVAHHTLTGDHEPFLFIDTAGCGFDEKREGNSTSNPEEAGFLLKHLSRLMSGFQEETEDYPTVAVISPYRHQVEVMKELLASYKDLADLTNRISINTIDSFQGQERDVVYISLTRSNAENAIGFLSEIRRMNVAMTRARKKLVMIGDSATLSQFSFYADLIEYAQKNNGYVSAWELMEI